MDMKEIDQLRQSSRRVVRELGMLEMKDKGQEEHPHEWHALVEISTDPEMTITKLSRLLLLSQSKMSRTITKLSEKGLVDYKKAYDKREKFLCLTEKGKDKTAEIDSFSIDKIKGAFEFLTEEEREKVRSSMALYAKALEKNRQIKEQVSIHTLSTSRTLRKQIIAMIENIQKNEYLLPITNEINACILRAEEDFYYSNSYNFWYAVNATGDIIGSISLKKLSDQAGEIKKFFVTKEYRGKGIAQKLLEALLKAAKKHQFKTLFLGTVSSLEAAHVFYQKHGFHDITTEQLPSEFEIGPLDKRFFRYNL